MLIIYRFKIKIYHYLHDIEIPRTKIILHYIKNFKVKNTLYKFIKASVYKRAFETFSSYQLVLVLLSTRIKLGPASMKAIY